MDDAFRSFDRLADRGWLVLVLPHQLLRSWYLILLSTTLAASEFRLLGAAAAVDRVAPVAGFVPVWS